MSRRPAAAGAVAVVAAAGLVRVARARYGLVVVVGVSMEPTLRAGDRLLYRRRGRDPVRGDIVVLDAHHLPDHRLAPGDPVRLVKRVVAVGGDPRPGDVPGTAASVPPTHLVVRGDNPRSVDSRTWGVLPPDAVVGVVRRRHGTVVGSGADERAELGGQQR